MTDDDYLWNPRSPGPRDPLVERLEQTLRSRRLGLATRRIRPLVILPMAAAATLLVGLVGWNALSGAGEVTREAPPTLHAEDGVTQARGTPERGLAPSDAASEEQPAVVVEVDDPDVASESAEQGALADAAAVVADPDPDPESDEAAVTGEPAADAITGAPVDGAAAR